MASKRKSFVLHIDSLDILDDLTDEQAGQLFKAIKANQKGEVIELCPLVKIAFSPFKNQFARDNEKYQKIVERNKNNGLKGGRPKTQDIPEKPTGFSGNPDNPQKADNDSKSDSDSDSDNKDKDLVGGERQPKECFDYEVVKDAWNNACDSSKISSTKCRIIPEKAKKQLPKTYSKYCKVKKSTGHQPAERHKWCVDYFKAVLDRAKTFAGQEGDHQNWKPNLEYATRVNTYDQVMEWIYEKRA